MRCYYTKFAQDIHFDKIRYQQFLREQGLREYDIKHLNIFFITDFTHAHFRGSPALADGGAFFQRDEEYVAKRNEMALGLYRPYYPPSRPYAAIFLRPEQRKTPVHRLDPIFLNETLLHETRHHIQSCLDLPCCKPIDDAPADGDTFNERNQPWEIDAEEFAYRYVNQLSFFLPISRQWKRSDFQ
jgi:hypothetical protein